MRVPPTLIKRVHLAEPDRDTVKEVITGLAKAENYSVNEMTFNWTLSILKADLVAEVDSKLFTELFLVSSKWASEQMPKKRRRVATFSSVVKVAQKQTKLSQLAAAEAVAFYEIKEPSTLQKVAHQERLISLINIAAYLSFDETL